MSRWVGPFVQLLEMPLKKVLGSFLILQLKAKQQMIPTTAKSLQDLAAPKNNFPSNDFTSRPDLWWKYKDIYTERTEEGLYLNFQAHPYGMGLKHTKQDLSIIEFKIKLEIYFINC